MGSMLVNEACAGRIDGFDSGECSQYGLDGGPMKDERLAFMVDDGGLYV